MDPVWRCSWALLACLASSCSHQASPQPFTISHTSPALGPSDPPLLLNDAITVYFSAAVLPVSVTADAVTMIDEDGQQVPGQLRVGGNWVTFQPEPPLAAGLDDGSYRLGATYRLMIAGSPRSDAVRAADGRRLALASAFDVRIARAEEKPPGLPAPLRPPANGLPFLLRESDPTQQLPVDAPRLRLHFTQPVLPSSVLPAAFTVTLLAEPPVELLPLRAHVVKPRPASRSFAGFDEQPGTIVELDLGTYPRRADGGASAPLKAGDWITVGLGRQGLSVTDYAGNSPLPAPVQSWNVVAGSRLALMEWPAGDAQLVPEEDVMPGFEARGGCLRPAVRVEAGNGSLGVLRPRRDTVLRPGQPFDRGDGEIVVSRGAEFPFLAIDIARGIRVRVEATDSQVQLLACGAARIDGILELVSIPQPVPARHATQPVGQLANAVPVAIMTAGGIRVTGVIEARTPAVENTTNLLLATAGNLDLNGQLPFHTLLATEAGGEGGAATIRGMRGQSLVFPAAMFTPGLAAGADFAVRGLTTWRAMPLDRDGGVVHLADQSPEIQVAWQSAPADPVRKNEPDLGIGRISRLQPVGHGDAIAVTAGAYVRFAFQTQVRSGRALPRMLALRVFDR